MRKLGIVLCAALCATLGVDALRAGETLENPNLAFAAEASASSEYGIGYVAVGAVDGEIPEALKASDSGRAWAVRGEDCRGAAEIVLTWENPRKVSTLV